MKIKNIRVYRLRIPFRFSFSHSRAARSMADNVVVALELECGITGFGEGVPRKYVTGETIEGAVEALKNVDYEKMAAEVHSSSDPFSALIEVASRLAVHGNAARCALEIALLDAAGQLGGERLSDIIRGRCSRAARGPSPPPYSAVMSLGRGSAVLAAVVFRLFGFRDLKVKIGPESAREIERIRSVRRWFGRGRIRLDANGCLDKAGLFRIFEGMKESDVWAIEDPLAGAELLELLSHEERLAVPIIIDEPFYTRRDMERFLGANATCIMNIRISKCGGILSASEMASAILKRGGAFGLGCQVGESAILSAAGRHFAEAFPEVAFLEGSYDRYLLSDNVVDGGVSFGYGGRWEVLAGSGLGIEVDQQKLERLAGSPLQLWKRE